MISTRWTGNADGMRVLSVRDGAGPRERREGTNPHLVSLLAPESFEAEQYRALRHVVESMQRGSGFKTIAVSSAAAGEWKTTTAINLAGALAQASEARVLLIDADLRLPSIAEQIGLSEPAPGLADAIQDPATSLAAVIRRLPDVNLSVVTAGRRPASPYETIGSPRLGEIVLEARQAYDLLVIDAPPLIPVPDGRILSRLVDGVLLVVAAHRTPRKLVEEALGLLDPEKVIGLVLNGDDRPYSGYYGSYYGYGRARDKDRGGRWGYVARRRPA